MRRYEAFVLSRLKIYFLRLELINYRIRMVVDYVKENVPARPPLPWWTVVCALAAVAAAFGVATLVDHALPTPLKRGDAPPDRFIAETAYEHMVNLTNIGPRVAGSYENEVAAVAVLVAAAKGIARAASAHNVVEVDLQRASGGFSLAFFDGMNNVYRDVQSVVVRARAAGGHATSPSRRTALLLNCHFDTVPDSPGASDDAAGCAVGLETLRALAAAPRPLRHDVLLLLNGAEENIMQASHAFITQHKWARSVRAFINVEACGAGGREVLFQAGPHDPWIVEVYARAVPHPFATSMAQEMFESGLIPADTDFRIFRDFGQLSGVDLAWSSGGYAYHTRLDGPERVPLDVLQRTGDNVLALANGLLSSESLESEVDRSSGHPVFFDLLGLAVVVARPSAALAGALFALALLALRLRISAHHAHRHLYISRWRWVRAVWSAGARQMAAVAAGAACAGTVGLALHVANARLAFFSQPALVAPLFATPAVAAALALLTLPGGPLPPAVGRGWWAARAAADAQALLGGVALAACALLRVRSGYVFFLWIILPTIVDLLATALSATGGQRMAWWMVGWVVPCLQTSYLARDSLAMLVPLCGRAPAPPLPMDAVMGAVVALVTIAAGAWVAPLAVAARAVRRTTVALALVGVVTAALVVFGGVYHPYSIDRPQRLMVFHVRRHHHLPAGPPRVEDFFWVPELDANTAATLDALPEWVGGRTKTGGEECSRWVYCGAPYYLPVLGWAPTAHRLPAPPAPSLAALTVDVETRTLAPAEYELQLDVLGPSHVVVVVSPVRGGVVTWSSAVAKPVEAARWGRRRTYFVTMHAAKDAHSVPRRLTMRIRLPTEEGEGEDGSGEKIAQISVAGHAMEGPRGEGLDALFGTLPDSVAPTGWPVHLHLYHL